MKNSEQKESNLAAKENFTKLPKKLRFYLKNHQMEITNAKSSVHHKKK